MAMESVANQHEEEMARIQAAGNQQWSERLHQQQQAQNDQMMQLLQTMAGARAPQAAYQPQPSGAPTKFCTECGKRIPTDSKHCPECGTKQL
jgi:membrane protease subunit (stomatin/prohibitin family)